VPEETEDLKQSFDSVLRVAKRRRWWILSAFCAVTIGAVVASYLIPAQYKSDATILVDQQKVSEKYVTPNSNIDLVQELQKLTQEVLSRNQLLQIINDCNLYTAERGRLGPDELVELMKKSLDIEPLVPTGDRREHELNAFRISFVGSKPDTTREVVNRVTSLLIVANLKTRTEDSEQTTSFLQAQLATAQADLRQQEQRLREFKMEHLGELPTEQQPNLQNLASLQSQLQSNAAALGRAREQRLYMESLLAQSRSFAPKTGADPTLPGPNRIAAVEKQLTDLRTQRAALIAHYTPEHPDVVSMNRQIAQTEALLETLKKSQKSPDAGTGTDSAALQVSVDDDPGTAQLKSQLKANQLEIANYIEDEKHLQVRISDYQRRLNLTPVREQQLADLMRDYTLSQQHYADLEGKKTQSELATSLDKNQQGRQFRIIDPASMPTKPFSPDRRKFGMMGAGVGLAIGAVLALILEMKDSSFHTDREVSRLVDLPFVFGVPLMLSPTEKKSRAQKRWLEWAGASLLVTIVLVVEAYVMLKG
jgi:succinoglycan biosynthesis transport protein ExoP